MIVLDASAIIDWLLDSPQRGPAISEWLVRIRHPHTLDFADIEVVSTLRRKTMIRELTERRAQQALDDLFNTRLRRHRVAPLAGRAWELRHTHNPYDAGYVALAEALDIPLLTTDGPLSRSGGHQATIVLPTLG